MTKVVGLMILFGIAAGLMAKFAMPVVWPTIAIVMAVDLAWDFQILVHTRHAPSAGDDTKPAILGGFTRRWVAAIAMIWAFASASSIADLAARGVDRRLSS